MAYRLVYWLWSHTLRHVLPKQSAASRRRYEKAAPKLGDRLLLSLPYMYIRDPVLRAKQEADWERLEPFFTELACDHQRVVLKRDAH